MPDNSPEVYVVLARLWQWYAKNRMAPKAFQNFWIRRHAGVPTDRAIAVLETHAAEYPDETKPSWKLIAQALSQSRGGDGVNEVEQILNLVRLENKTIGGGPSTATPDNMAWYAFVDAQTYPMTHDPRSREPREDNDGRLAELASKERGFWQSWAERCYLNAGEQVPQWLRS